MATQQRVEVEKTAVSRWDEILRRFPHATVFHSLAWLRAIADAYSLSIHLLQASIDGELVAAWPVLETRKGPLRILGSPLPGWSTAYMGPLVAPDAAEAGSEIIGAFLEHAALRRHAYFACKVVNQIPAIDLGAFGFRITHRFPTLLLNVQRSDDDIFAGFRRQCRNHIRRAENLGVEIAQETDAGFIDDYWAMTVETFGKSETPPTHNKRLVQTMCERLMPIGRMHPLSAMLRGKRIASIILLSDDRTVYYWGGGSRQAHRDVPANNLLQWHGIQLARRLGACQYDFIANTGGPGKFKASFGPKQVETATHWERSSSRLVDLLKQGYERYRRSRLAAAAR